MSKRVRYFLIILGFVVFAILAPVIVIYVRGLSYDFSTHRFVKTGILSLKTDPETVDIYLNQKLVRQSSSDIRFLTPEEYELTLKKQGYFDWAKRLTILPGSVAWVYPAYTKIYLLKNPPLETTIGKGILDFYQNGDTLAYITSDNLVISSLHDLSHSQNYALPKPVDTILPTGDGNNLVLTDSNTTSPVVLLFSTQNSNFTDLSANFTQPPELQFFNSRLYALSDGTLSDFDAGAQPQTIRSDVETFTIDGSTLYYISRGATSTDFALSQWPFTSSQTVMTNLPIKLPSKIIIDSNKHVFLVADGNMYRLASTLIPLAENVSEYGFDEPKTQLVYMASGEIHQYNPQNDADTLLTRSVSPLANLILSTSYNYVFYSDQAGITALDLNTGSPRNEYPLYYGQIKKMSLDSGDSTIVLLDGTTLKSLVIR